MLNLSFADRAILGLDKLLKHNFKATPTQVRRPNPAATIIFSEQLNQQEQQQSVAMMRINHSGEICAQALYQGQALTAKTSKQRNALLQAAAEESDHLAWCQQRLNELNGRTSVLNPVWYAGSLGIGALAGLAGDTISLGFVAETEHQVSKHLAEHLLKMSLKDQKSRAILEQMRSDELEHATQAERAGARRLPLPIKILMKFTAKILTITAARF